jgi:hypothetical protein
MTEQTSRSVLCDLYVELVPVSGASITLFRHPGAESTICRSADDVARDVFARHIDFAQDGRLG